MQHNRLYKFEKRRKIILDTLKKESMTFEELKNTTGIPDRSLIRHINTLVDFGCIGKEPMDTLWGAPPFRYYFICSCICYDV